MNNITKNDGVILNFFSDLTDPAISNSSHSVQNESSSAIFECLVTGTLPIQIHWEKEGEIVATGSFLKFQNISKNNESTYACVVGNQAGKKTVDFSLSVACKYEDKFVNNHLPS